MLKQFFILLSVFMILCGYANDSTCEPSNISYSLRESLEIQGVKEVVPVSGTLEFSACKIESLATKISEKEGEPVLTLKNLLASLFSATPQNVKQFCSPNDQDQCDALLLQKSLFAKKGITFSDIYFRHFIKVANYSYFIFDFKNFGSQILSFQKGITGKWQLVKPDFDELLVQHILNIPEQIKSQTSNPVAPKPYTYSLNLPLDLKSGQQAVARFKFNILKNGSEEFKKVTKFFNQLVDLAKNNKTEAFLSHVDKPKSWTRAWESDKISCPKCTNLGLPGTAQTWSRYVPIAALNLDPIVLIYFSDKNKKSIVDVALFLKKEGKLILLNPQYNPMRSLYTNDRMKAAALESLAFESLKSVGR